MGSGRDKRKKQKGKTPGAGAEKTAKKAEKNALKEQRRAERSTEVWILTIQCGGSVSVLPLRLARYQGGPLLQA
jgi:hypothetical protein